MSINRILCAMAISACGTFPALAQETVLTNDTAAGGAPAAASWATECVSGGRQGSSDCSVSQRLLMKSTGQIVGSITIRVPAGGKPLLIASTPLGLSIPAGVKVDVDDTMVQKLELQTCDRNGCYANAALSDNLLSAMQKGKKFSITFQNLSTQPVALPLSLNGFAAAYQKIK